jgi:MiaB/RimO family radical SAM methylthiotransferase
MFSWPLVSPFLSLVHFLSEKKVCILTYGCTYNEGDSSRFSAIISKVGGIITNDIEDAEIIILNSCIVVEKTERRMIKLLHTLTDEGREVIVTGCLPSARPDILNEFPSVRVVAPEELYIASQGVLPHMSGPIAVVQIGSGCMGACTYCITRLARGRIRSIPEDIILSQIREAVRGGAVEIRLTGQDLSAYGCDNMNGPRLPSLMRNISQIPGIFRVRLGMMNPATLIPIADEVADILGDGHFFSFVHLPVQSGSDTILSLMGREYTRSDYLKLVQIFRIKNPGIVIATDIIAGFTGESEADFHSTCSLIQMIRPGMVNVTRYSYRPGSTASRENELPDRKKKDRSRELIRVGYTILKEEKRKMVGKICPVLITEQIRPGTVMGRTATYVGVVIHSDISPGCQYLVEITDERIHYLIGQVISPK